MNDRHRERRSGVHRDARRVGGTLHIFHQRMLAPDETGAADDEHDDRNKKLRACKIVLPQRSGRGAERQQDDAVPDNARLQQLGDGFSHGRFTPFQSHRYALARTGTISIHYSKCRRDLQARAQQNRADPTHRVWPKRRFYAFDKKKQKNLYTLGEICAILHAVWEKTPGMIHVGGTLGFCAAASPRH